MFFMYLENYLNILKIKYILIVFKILIYYFVLRILVFKSFFILLKFKKIFNLYTQIIQKVKKVFSKLDSQYFKITE